VRSIEHFAGVRTQYMAEVRHMALLSQYAATRGKGLNMQRERTKRLANPSHPPLKIHFLGAAGTVTGSLFLVERFFKNRIVRFLVDVGQHQGSEQMDKGNRLPQGITASMIDFVLITHAHIDHSGWLPKLIKDGFKGFAYTHPATLDLLKILFPDSGRLQEMDADQTNRRLARRGKTFRVSPIYGIDDAHAALDSIKLIEYGVEQNFADGDIRVKFTDAGHILGSAVVTVTVGSGKDERIICFNGNIGRPNTALLKPVELVRKAHVLIAESTYGNVLHDRRDRLQALADIINAAHGRALKFRHEKYGCGKICIPAFAIGRVQAVLYDLRVLMEQKRIPQIPVFLDSKMAIAATDVYYEHPELLNEETRGLLARGKDPIKPAKFIACRNKRQKDLLDKPANEPIIIIGSSGMAAGGPIRKHVKRYLPGLQNTVLFVGHQEEGGLGYNLLNGKPSSVQIGKDLVRCNATVELMMDYSGHADFEDSIDWMRHIERAPQVTFLVHGEPDGLLGFKQHIQDKLGWAVTIPQHRQSFAIR
jgi:metallo-beta-lactamase family protein